jgi:7,8-dihydropterin-6-yl-methyl-4-(beta-D-ribofuranosyl)aminobenzene 5'-phosphate synthase
MGTEVIPLAEVDSVNVSILCDNSVDILMVGSAVARRFKLRNDLFEHPLPIAEHGFSALIEVQKGESSGKLMFDTGVSKQGILYNMDAMEIDAHDVQAIILSHGHPDHAMGLPGLVERLGRMRMPLILHPDAFLQRRLVLPSGMELQWPPPNKADLRRMGVEIVEEVGPSMMVDGMVLISGEVVRTTEFERGLAGHQSWRHDHWEADPMIHDDQCAIVNVAGKGLVVVTGCGHAGVINVVRNAQRITGIDKVYAVIGGFHLTGPGFEPFIEPTVAALKAIAPACVVPGHCTGWRAAQRIAVEMPDAFVASSVGTTLML